MYEAQKLKNQELLNDLDQKSEWRKELMNIAAKPVMHLEDVYRILASLRFYLNVKKKLKEKKVQESKMKDNQMKKDKKDRKIKVIEKVAQIKKNLMLYQIISTKRLNTMLNERLNNLSVNETLTDEVLNRPFQLKNEEIRLYTKFLLKHHWEYNKGEEDKEEFKNKELSEFKKCYKGNI